MASLRFCATLRLCVKLILLESVLAMSAAARQQEPSGRSATDPGAAPAVAEGPSVIVTGVSDKAFPRITTQFEVKRPDGSFLRDAKHEDFRVTEEDREVPIVEFQAPVTTEIIPTTLVLVVDRSGSMNNEDRIGGLKRAVASFLEKLPPGSRVALISFASEVDQLSGFTTDLGRVREQVDALEAEGSTRFYDAVARALTLLEGESGRRAVLALTDGEDTASDTDLATVVDKARRLGLPVYTLGLGSEREIRGQELRRLADSTRGQYYPARRAEQLRAIYEQIAERIGSSYVLTYQTARTLPDGTLRPIRISYRGGRTSGEAAVFIHGMVAPAAGWSPLFLGLAIVLAALLAVPPYLRRHPVLARPGRATKEATSP
jgi:VWFA-related protein